MQPKCQTRGRKLLVVEGKGSLETKGKRAMKLNTERSQQAGQRTWWPFFPKPTHFLLLELCLCWCCSFEPHYSSPPSVSAPWQQYNNILTCLQNIPPQLLAQQLECNLGINQTLQWPSVTLCWPTSLVLQRSITPVLPMFLYSMPISRSRYLSLKRGLPILVLFLHLECSPIRTLRSRFCLGSKPWLQGYPLRKTFLTSSPSSPTSFPAQFSSKRWTHGVASFTLVRSGLFITVSPEHRKARLC